MDQERRERRSEPIFLYMLTFLLNDLDVLMNSYALARMGSDETDELMAESIRKLAMRLGATEEDFIRADEALRATNELFKNLDRKIDLEEK